MTDNGDFEWDVFICHATEDKDTFVRELTSSLSGEGISIWYDEFTLRVGDSLRETIEKGISKSRYGIVVLSPNFFQKDWPQRELNVLLQRDSRNQRVILPVWLNIDYAGIAHHSILLAGIMATKAEYGMDRVVHDLMQVLRSNSPYETT